MISQTINLTFGFKNVNLSFKDLFATGDILAKSCLYPAVAVEHLSEMEAVNDERYGHMEVLRAAHRPEYQFPVIKPAPVYYSQKPYRLDKRFDVLVMNSDFDFR